MPERIQHIHHVQTPASSVDHTEREIVKDESATAAPAQHIAARVIWYIAGVLLVLLAFRFVLALLGANSANGFVNFIYTISHPFVAPFFGVFGYNPHYGVAHFELYTLVAMAVYAVIAWGLARLFTISED